MTPREPTRAFLLTPSGPAAIAMIRVVGPRSVDLADQVLNVRRTATLRDVEPDALALCRVHDGEESLDDAVVVHGIAHEQSVVDVCLHGGSRIVERTLQAFERQGAVTGQTPSEAASAWPARNTLEREALPALVHAKTDRALDFLAWQRKHLGAAIAELADSTPQNPDRIRTDLQRMCDRFASARTLIHGATVAIVGPPNSGKSTLFNRLLGRNAAIVSPVAGTTRDWVTGELEIEGIPITLIDTAGEHVTEDDLERQAIRLGRARSRAADVALIVTDASTESPADFTGWVDHDSPVTRRIAVVNKTDLMPARGCDFSKFESPIPAAETVSIAALTGVGLAQLTTAIVRNLGLADWSDRRPTLFTARQFRVARRVLSDTSAGIGDYRACFDQLTHGELSSTVDDYNQAR